MSSTPKLYGELATWWPLLSAPEDYAEEAEMFRSVLTGACAAPPRSVLELGSGGGNNASYLKAHLEMTLVDLSPKMLAVSRALNPECEHVQGDMRSVRIGRTFDAVFVHDAVCYMTTRADLRRAVGTAYEHCEPGGVALFVPDYLRETFEPATEHGGGDGERRSLRYLAWVWDPDPNDTTYVVDYAYLLREDGETRVLHDRHIEGLFTRDEWLRCLAEAGFEAEVIALEHSEVEPGSYQGFVGRRPA
jgi:SAM-dependent methyltransferase